MKVIYKYELEMQQQTVHSIPEGAIVLTVAKQNGKICVWALVDTDNPKRDHYFFIFGTGNPIPDDLLCPMYLGTIQDAPFVWHVFHQYSNYK